MLNFRPVDMNLKFIAVDFEAQILPGTFEHAASVLVDQELDLSPLVETCRNDEIGGVLALRAGLVGCGGQANPRQVASATARLDPEFCYEPRFTRR